MARTLTQRSIENLKPGSVRIELPDKLVPGLYLIIQPSGRKSWAARYRIAGRTRKHTLGPYPLITLAKARELGRDVLIKAKEGRDAGAEKKAAPTVRSVCEEYLRREGGKLRTVKQRVRLLGKHVLPEIGGHPIGAVKRGVILQLLRKVEDESGGATAEKVLSAIRRVFTWYAVSDEDFHSPIVPGMLSARDIARGRSLDDAEIRRLWAASLRLGTFGALMRILLLTGARRSEAAELQWGEIAGDCWRLPAARNKVKVDLERPLSRAALAIIDAQPRLDGCPYVFTLDGRCPVAGFTKLKAKLDRESGVTSWVIHDLRRTARSLLPRAGVSPDVAERCLGHVIPGVRGIYDRHRYIEEMRHAYEALATLIERIVDNPQDNVVPMRG